MVVCSPLPGDLGATCDQFLVSNPLTLTSGEWTELQAEWNERGLAVECTTSRSIGNLKREVEQLCSVASCDYETEQKILAGLKKLEALGKPKL
jgi:hypothetical protein